jgi:acid stress chaperone HdeA
MNLKNTLIAVISLLISSVAFAAEMQHASDAEKPKLTKMQCKEFLAFEPTYRPMIVYWASAYVEGGKPEDAMLEIEETEQLVPVVIAACKKTPQASFWQTLKTKYKEINS